MQKWCAEDWEFEVTVLSSTVSECRLGFEEGDRFAFQYETPASFCPRTMIQIYTWCEVIRCGGDFTKRGCKEKYIMDLTCPCNSVRFRLVAKPINRDENGAYIGVNKEIVQR